MLKNKYSRHSLAFCAIIIGSILLYPAARWELTPLVWVLLGMILAANLLALATQ